MIKLVVAAAVCLAVLVACAATATAQPRELPLADFLEKRVPDELAAEGKILSRESLALKVDQAGPYLIISLVDLDTGRAAASTKLDQIPDDREAAVASVTHVAADLLAQVAGRPKVSHDTRAAMAEQERKAELARRAEARRKAEAAALARREIDREAARKNLEMAAIYHKEMLRFSPHYSLYTSTTSPKSTSWTPYRGELEHEIDPHEFYRIVGRPELGSSYDRRKAAGVIAMIVGTGAAIGAVVVLLEGNGQHACTLGDASYDQCESDNTAATEQYALIDLALAGVATAGAILGFHYLLHPQPITEEEASTLAAQYNQKLRSKYGVTGSRTPILRDVRVAPFLAGNEGGLSIGGRF